MRFPGFEGEWEMIRLGELTKLITKGTTPKKFVSEGVKFIKIECFEGNIINSERCLYIDEKVHHKELRRSILEENDLLFAIAGATIGKTNIVTKEILPANTNQALAIIRLNTNENINFIYQILKSDIMQKYIKDSISVGAQPNLNLQQMNDFSFHHPSLSEQNKISSLLTSIDERIQTQKKIIEQLETLMRANREKLFSQKLRFKDDGGNYFSDWSLTELKNVCSIIGGGTPDTQKSEFWNGNIQWFTPTEIKSNFVFKSERTISELGLKNSSAKILPKGSILLTTRATIGEVAIAQEECTTNQGFQSLIVKENCNNVFLFHWIKENKLELIKRANGSTFPEISKSEIEVIKILLPSINEQTKIANCLSSIQEKIDTERHILEKLDLQKKFLLANLFL